MIPKRPTRTLPLSWDTSPEQEGLPTTADIVAEDIEAGYDIQSDAAERPMVSDPASSSDDEVY